MGERLLDIEGLSIRYSSDERTVAAVNGLSLSLDRGENLGLVGETGAGKTTTALGILGLLPKKTGKVSSGRILFKGEDLVSLKEERLREIRGSEISMIFQDPMTSLNPVLTVGEQIAEVLRYHSYDRQSPAAIEARIDEILGMVGIQPQRKREYPHQFSGGMKQRIVIAMALACEPELLLADEPTTALDVTIQAQVLALMDDLKGKLGTSMILITHDLGVVAENCDKVAIMYAGEIIESGSAEDIFEGERHHPYTAGLFASIPDLEVEARRLSPIGGLMPDPTDLPSGCKFHPRCARCMESCRAEEPAARRSGSHMVKCHLFSD